MTKAASRTASTGLALLLLGIAGLLSVGSARAPAGARDPRAMVRQMTPASARAAQDAWETAPAEDPEEVTLVPRYPYRGPHPIHPDYGTGYCTEPGLHREPYPPFEPELFTLVDGAWVFVGDPSDFGYDGPLYAYANPHPLDAEHGEAWCYYPWTHYHDFLLSGPLYDVIGGVVYYVGAFTADFLSALPFWRGFFLRHYRRHYRHGRLYRAHAPRYRRVRRNRWRRLRPRMPRRWFRPYRARLARLPTRTGRSVSDGPATHGRQHRAAPAWGRWQRVPAGRYRPVYGAGRRLPAGRLRRPSPPGRGRLDRVGSPVLRHGRWRWRGPRRAVRPSGQRHRAFRRAGRARRAWRWRPTRRWRRRGRQGARSRRSVSRRTSRSRPRARSRRRR